MNNKNMNLQAIIQRIGYVRSASNLSARELSYRIGKTSGYIHKLENSGFNLSVQALLDIVEVCNIPLEKFFYNNIDDYDLDMQILSLLKGINKDKKYAIIELLKN